MAGWRVAFAVGNAEVVGAFGETEELSGLWDFPAHPDRFDRGFNQVPDYPNTVNAILTESRRDTLVDGLNRIGWSVAKPVGTMFVLAQVPEPYQEMGSLDFARYLVTDADAASSPGMGFGSGGEGYIRFALVENEQRIGPAVNSGGR